MGWMPAPPGNGCYNPFVPLLGNAEKAELERLILERLTEYHNQHGSSALLVEGAPEMVARDPRVKAVYLGTADSQFA